ncbi:prepilin-type N-terminal cleavage/methylation domain-containing protein [Allorhodopirellula solitaria]|uniref:Prepilin-type N-terminal cleavage/methylation domain-containing protein n=1 Tax=Allorhodopirellula solitaria TaxID=2527987 RepID=A0A5C5XWV5_9BACT|nr:prepilin-type N-terminal cleavage/methylation domain-containing protein [Allorhodopirellula solitaria]TWT66375.1 hypothetical protein CA85_24690 [Allorhodopirellula solitaria]
MKTAGFTLLELLLAMVIAAAAAAMVIPIAGTMLGDRELVRAGDQIRAEMTRLRVHAIREGRVMTLQSNPDSGEMMVVPKFSGSDAVESSSSSAAPSALLTGAEQAMGVTTPATSSASSGWTFELPENVVVRAVVTSPVGGTSSVEAALLDTAAPANPAVGGTPTGTLPVIYFYPTGQTSNAIITIGRKSDGDSSSAAAAANVARVQVRGLTGDVTMRAAP